MALIELVYRSRTEIEWTHSSLSELLAHSRENNLVAGVSGVLLYRPGEFLQVLEGEEAGVISLFQHISQDPRHFDIETLRMGQIDDRNFPKWSMGFDAPVTAKQSQPELDKLVLDGGLCDKRFAALRAKFCSVTYELLKQFINREL
ncbi:BLUF domain-containing protein [Corallincola platygyrae]|uniref:BLUF domain-containing protein n=1 Tax=Corallincola platygyrae TaxID=1193278 RepID=A0ABW4XMC8_9GAMM